MMAQDLQQVLNGNLSFNDTIKDNMATYKYSLIPSRWHALAYLIVLLLIISEIIFRNSDAYKKLKNMPGPFKFPLLGNAHLVLGLNNSEIMIKALEYLAYYGETICGCLGHVLIVFLTNPSDMEIVLNNSEHLEKAPEYGFFKPWFGDGLLISKGDHWSLHRRMIAPTFHQSILKSFVPQFVKHSKNVANNLSHLLGKEFDVHEHMSQTTVEILLSTAMGVKKLPPHNRILQYAHAVIDMCDIIHQRQLKFIYRPDFIYKFTKLREKADRMLKVIQSLTQQVIAERRELFNSETDGVFDEQRQPQQQEKSVSETMPNYRDDLDEIDESDVGAKRRLALLDAMVEMTKDPNIEWTDKDVVDEVNTIMFEGHDTTSAGSSFVLVLLGIHKDVQQKVYAEQQSIFGADMQRDVTFNDTLQMNYLERVIKETLRLYPPVPAIARKVSSDVKLASGPYIIPKGTTVVMGPYAVHRRADLYKNPNKFNPDNFLPENVSKRHYYSFIPFSAGPRSCVGRKYAMLMLKVLLSTLLRRYEVHSNLKEENFKMQGDIILKLTNGFNIILQPRS